MRIPAQLLQKWPAARHSAELWRAASGEEVDPERLAQAYIHVVAAAPRQDEAYYRLLDDGFFRAAEDFPPPDASREEYEAALWTARSRLVLTIRDRVADLQERCAWVHRSDLLSPAMCQNILESSGQEGWVALQLLAQVDEALQQAEQAHAGELLRRISEHERNTTGHDTAPTSWIVAVERAIRNYDFDLAEQLLSSGPDGIAEDPAPLPERPAFWPDDADDLREVLEWFFSGEGAQRDFYAKWCPHDDDHAAWQLLSVLRAMIEEPAVDHETVGRFAGALEDFLGEPPSTDKSVVAVPGGFRAEARGWVDPGAPALATAMRDEAVPLYVATSGGRVEFQESVEEAPVLLFTLGSNVTSAPGVLRFGPEDLFRAMPDASNRRLNVLRTVMPRLPLSRALPVDPTASSLAFFARAREVGRLLDRNSPAVQLVFGCPGTGTSALLKRTEYLMRREGWRVIGLKEFEEESAEMRELLTQPASSPGAFAQWLREHGSVGVVVTSDGVASGDLAKIPNLVAAARQFPGMLRVIWAGGFETRDTLAPYLSGAEAWQLPALPFREVRAFIGRILDVHGLRWADRVLERIAYYSAGRPAIAHLLLRTLFLLRTEGGLPAQARITLNHVEEAVHNTDFSREVRHWLLHPIEGNRWLRTVYAGVVAALFLDGSLMDRVPRSTGEHVREFLLGEDLFVSGDLFRRAMDRLAELQVIDPILTMDSPVVPATGAISRMCVGLIDDDPLVYLTKTKDFIRGFADSIS